MAKKLSGIHAHVQRDAKKGERRPQLSQKEIPSATLDEALRVPIAIAENYGNKPTSPLLIAKAMGMQPNSGPFRMLCGAATAYGLTNGSARTPLISIEPLGMRIVRPTAEGDNITARREAIMKPKIIRDFLTRYNNAPIPPNQIAINVLLEMGIPAPRANEVLTLILQSVEQEGLITDIKGKKYVNFSITPAAQSPEESSSESELAEPTLAPRPRAAAIPQSPQTKPEDRPTNSDPRLRRVYLSHGKNREFIEPIRKWLRVAELEAVVSVETHTVAQPVPDKVTGQMRSCGAAIIHVDVERVLVDPADGKQVTILNDNVLIEIGAAMALYGRRFILLVRTGVALPTNLQGLSEVRYANDVLSADEAMNLLTAIGDIKNHPLPKMSEG